MARARSGWLVAGLGLTLVATWYAAGLEDPEADARPVELRVPDRSTAAAAGTRPAAASAAATPADAPRTAPPPLGTAPRMTQASADLFAPHSWQPPPPPPPEPAPVAEAPAVAPPLPFRYLGRLEEDGAVAVFLAEGNQHPRLVRQGDSLPNYRVDHITAEGMQLTYLPLNQTQSLPFGTDP